MDPMLWELLAEGSPDDMVEVLVKLSRPEKTLPSSVYIVARIGDIVSCRIRRGDIETIRRHEAVFSMKGPRKITINWPYEETRRHDASVKDREEPNLIRRPDVSLTGKNVAIGIADSGIDVTHPSFCHPDGSSRFAAFWDQEAEYDGVNTYGYGAVYDQAEISSALSSEFPFRELRNHPGKSDIFEQGTHGSHVLGIAAGNDNAGAPGIAPDAVLVAVNLASEQFKDLMGLGDSVRLFDAVHFLDKSAASQPLVTVLCLGDHCGPNRGLSLIEQAVDYLSISKAGRTYVNSAGNYFLGRTHTGGKLSTGEQAKLSWLIADQDKTPNEIDIWYEPGDEIRISLFDPAGNCLLDEQGIGRLDIRDTNGVLIGNFYHRDNEPSSGLNNAAIFLKGHAIPGNWKILLRGTRIANGRYEAWIERDSRSGIHQSRFSLHQADSAMTTGSICNGYHNICVGAYDPTDPQKKVCSFSSAGPTWDGRTKPDLVAPGERILSAKSAAPDEDRSPGQLTQKSGTSMAAPYVAGICALLYEAFGTSMTGQEMKRKVLQACRLPEHVDEQERQRYGNGILDMEQLFPGYLVKQEPKQIAKKNNMNGSDSNQRHTSIESLLEACRQRFPELNEGNLKGFFESLSPASVPANGIDLQRGDVLIRRQFGHHEAGWYGLVESVQGNEVQVFSPGKGRGRIRLSRHNAWELRSVRPGCGCLKSQQHSEPDLAEAVSENGYADEVEPLASRRLPVAKAADTFGEEDPPSPAGCLIDEDVEKVHPDIDANKTLPLNNQFWRLYEMEKIKPLSGISPLCTPNLYANKVREGQELLRSARFTLKGMRLQSDGVLGFRSLIMFSEVARQSRFKETRFQLAGMGFNMDGLAKPDARRAVRRAWTVLAPLEFLDGWSVESDAEKVLKNLSWGDDATTDERAKAFLDRVLFSGAPPDWLENDNGLRIRMSLLLDAFKGEKLQGRVAIVRAKRRFLHDLWDGWEFFKQNSKFVPAVLHSWVTGKVKTSSDAEKRDYVFQTDAQRKWIKDFGLSGPEGEESITGMLVQHFVPYKNIDLSTALTAFQGDASAMARQLLELLRADERREYKILYVTRFIHGLPYNANAFANLFLGELEKQLQAEKDSPGGLEKIPPLVERLRSMEVLRLLVQFAFGSKYEQHPAIVRMADAYQKLQDRVNTHEYITTGQTPGVRLKKKSGETAFVEYGEVTPGAHRIRKTMTTLKKARSEALVEKMAELLRKELAKAIQAGENPHELQGKNEEQLMTELFEKAKKELNITDSDMVEATYEEGFRVLEIKRETIKGVEAISVRYERVYRLDEGGEYKSDANCDAKCADKKGWKPMEGHEKESETFQSSDQFEEDLGWVYFSNEMKYLSKVVTVIGVVGTAPLIIVFAGPKLVAASIVISVGIYVGKVLLTDEEFSKDGFIKAVLEGYVGALGMRLFYPAAGGAVRLLGGFRVTAVLFAKESFRGKLAGFLVYASVGGGGSGAFALAGGQFMEDILLKGSLSDIRVYVAQLKTGFLMGVVFDIGGGVFGKDIQKVLGAGAAGLKKLASSEVWQLVKEKLSKEALQSLPKEALESLLKFKSWSAKTFQDPDLLLKLSVKGKESMDEFFAAVAKSPSKLVSRFETAVYQNALFLAEKELAGEAVEGLARLVKAGQAGKLPVERINEAVDVFKYAGDVKQVNAWFQMLNELDETLLQKLLAAGEIKKLAASKYILDLRTALGEKGGLVSDVFQLHFNGGAVDFDGFAARILTLSPDKVELGITLLISKGASLSPQSLVYVLQKNVRLADESVLFGLERLGRAAKALGTDQELWLKAVPDDKLESLLSSVSTLSEKELTLLSKIDAAKDKTLFDQIVRNAGDKAQLEKMLQHLSTINSSGRLPAVPSSILQMPKSPSVVRILTDEVKGYLTGLRNFFLLKDKQTAGVLIGDVRGAPTDFPLKSGNDGGFHGAQNGGIPRGIGEGFATVPTEKNIVTHVEGHAAAVMWQKDIKDGVLYIDRSTCKVCDRSKSTTDPATPALSTVLPPGSTLTVISPDGVEIFRSVN